MRIWLDTEFYEDGHLIQLISLGAIREDGAMFYEETPEAAQLARATPWLEQNVLPHLKFTPGATKTRQMIAREFDEFAGAQPQFWAYYASYDWVSVCQLFGRMLDLPARWPKYCRDFKQHIATIAPDYVLPPQQTTAHNALNDAIWLSACHLAFDQKFALTVTPK
jgi:hypothetical protein